MRVLNLCFAGMAVVAFAMTAHAQSIGVSFSGDNAGGTSINVGDATAGIFPQANWNEGVGAFGDIFDMVDSDGAVTTADVSWASDNTWGGTGADTPNEALVNGWIDDGGIGIECTVSNIPYATYNVYVYGSSDDGNQGRGLGYTVNGTTVTSVGKFVAEDLTPNGSYFDGTFVDGNTDNPNPSYYFFEGLSGDLVFSGARNDGERRALSGFQIIDSNTPLPILGDANGDNNFDFGDIEAFFLALTDPAAYAVQYPTVTLSALDMNADGNTDFGDIDAFFVALTAN